MNVTHYFHPQCQKNHEQGRKKENTKSYTESFLLFPKSVADGKIVSPKGKIRPGHSAPSFCAICRKCTPTP